MLIEEKKDNISEYFSMSSYEDVFLALAAGVEHLFLGEIEQDRDTAKAWFKQLVSHVEKHPSKRKEIEKVALTLLDYFPSFREASKTEPSFVDSLLHYLLTRKIFEHPALDIVLKLGANLTPLQAKPFLESLSVPEPSYVGASRYFFTHRFVFHLLMQPDLEAGGEHIFHSRVIRSFYQKLTDEEYQACYKRIFSKEAMKFDEQKSRVIEYAEKQFSIITPKPYKISISDVTEKDTPLESAIKRGASHPLELYNKLDKQSSASESVKLPLGLLYECFKDLPRVFEVLLKLLVKTNVSQAYSSVSLKPSLFQLVSDANDEAALIALESLDDAGWVHRAIRLNDVRELKQSLVGKKLTFEIEAEFEAHYGMKVLSYAQELYSENSSICRYLKTVGFELPMSVSAMQIEQGAGSVGRRDKCIVM